MLQQPLLYLEAAVFFSGTKKKHGLLSPLRCMMDFNNYGINKCFLILRVVSTYSILPLILI